jgi:ABC-2 type transport system permease protein
VKAVFKHELRSYYTGLTAYIFDAFLLLFAGIYVMVINLNAAYANFEYVLSNMSFIFLVIVPILTMRVIAEEKRQKTDLLLYSLPLSMNRVALGKYFAMLVVLAVPTVIIGIYPLLLRTFGDVYLPAAYSALTGFFFLGASLIAVGMFISSVTENQGVAAGICFVVMLLNYFIKDLSGYVSSSAFSSFACIAVSIVMLCLIFRVLTRSRPATLVLLLVLEIPLFVCYTLWSSKFEGLFSKVLVELSLFERFYTFVNGVFDLTGIVYFVSVSAVFVFLSVQSLDKRRWN